MDRLMLQCCVFLWDVCLICQEEEEHNDAGRLQISVMSSCDERKKSFEGTVGIL